MSEQTAHASLHAFVRGRVQGVGFRYFVERRAREMGVSGWVRNLGDGSRVEVYVEGPRQTLERLLEDLHRGPRSAAVEEVEARWSEAKGEVQGFGIRF